MRVLPVTKARIRDLDDLFATDGIVDRCWCMWFTVRVEDFHAAGRDGNRDSFTALVSTSRTPMGVIAYQGKTAVGWCGVGPRSRYVRALKTPTLRGRDQSEDDTVWLVTCFFIREDARDAGAMHALLNGAVRLARENGATAIEGFPDAAGKRSERGARGAERVFDACGFSVVRRSSPARVIMRKEFMDPA